MEFIWIFDCCLILLIAPSFQQETRPEWLQNAGSGEPERNKTGYVGRDVTLPCTLDYKEGTTIAWMDKFDNVLFFNEDRIIDESRFELLKKGSEWNLEINSLSLSDSGYYRCVINSEPVIVKYIELIILEPAAIDRAHSSQDIMASEGSNVYLVCNATGSPAPTVRWKYRKSTDAPNKAKDVRDEEGRIQVGVVLVIYNVTKDCDDIYECVAENAAGYPDRHEISVKVRFKPEVILPTQKLFQVLGKSTILTCFISAFPLDKEYWAKDGIQLKQDSNRKYVYEKVKEDDSSIILSITINDIGPYDYGTYKCAAFNSMGADAKYMELAPYTGPDMDFNRYPITARPGDTEVTYKPETPRPQPTTSRMRSRYRTRTTTRYQPLTLKPRTSPKPITKIKKTQPALKVSTHSSSCGLYPWTIAMVITTAVLNHCLIS